VSLLVVVLHNQRVLLVTFCFLSTSQLSCLNQFLVNSIGGRGVGVRGGAGGDKSKREIERMFTQKVRIYGQCKANRTTPLFCILKVAFKCLMETTRVLILPLHGHQQIQLEVHTLRTDLPLVFSADDLKVLHFLLDEVMTAANDRCTTVTNAPTTYYVRSHPSIYYDLI
jgi:ribosomal protein L39E